MRPQPAKRRLLDWPERLAAIVEERREREFSWGVHDCGMFAADVAQALTGEDPAAWLRGRYSSEAELEAIIVPMGGIEAAIEHTMAEFGAPECPPAYAQRGDWALVEVGNDLMTGVVLGDRVAVPGLDRLQFVPLRKALRTWAI